MCIKKVLVYGDSYTKGQIPNDLNGLYLPEETIPGKVQQFLGDDYEVINEGMCGRTTNITGKLPGDEDKNGFVHFAPTLEKHLPFATLVIFLGTNDLKERFNRSALEVAQAIEELVLEAKRVCNEHNLPLPHIIIVSPPLVKEENVHKPYRMKGAEEKSEALAELYKEVADRHLLGFINLADKVQPSKQDGIHLDPEANQIVAEVLYRMIIEA